MKAILLDGSAGGDAAAERVRTALTARLQARGWQVETAMLRDKKIAPCAGDFNCWLRTPGMCTTNDDNRLLAAAVAGSNLMVYLTPLTFGGYSSTLKGLVDHLIQNISPFFASIGGETHHQKRYDRYPDFLAVGWTAEPTPTAEAVFRQLVQRNAINYHASKSLAAVVPSAMSPAELEDRVEIWLDDLAGQKAGPQPAAPAAPQPAAAAFPVPLRAVLLAGSPRLAKSSSHFLGTYLMQQLAAAGLETESVQVYTSLNSPEKMDRLLEKVDAASLLVLAFPLYVDSLPAPIIRLLERLSAHRAGRAPAAGLAVVVNSGFPESRHNFPALAVCAEFSRQAGFTWAGGLGIGAGHGLVHSQPLEESGGQVFAIRRALDLAAQSLAGGGAIPAGAQALLDKPVIPGWLYRFMGGFGWIMNSLQQGTFRRLRRKTYPAAGFAGTPQPGEK